MQYFRTIWLLTWIGNFLIISCQPLPNQAKEKQPSRVILGSEILLTQKLDILKNKRVALVANATSVVFDSIHLVDALLEKKVNLVRIFAPEHGFRTDVDMEATVVNHTDTKTGLPIVSLYGKIKKPTYEHLADVDIVLFDIQDVGTRFYTYLTTMCYVMEACAEFDKEIIILDRPNPNGYYVAGPILDSSLTSFVGLHSVPIVHGMTLGEYARMVNGEKWLAGGRVAKLQVILCQEYRHKLRWQETGRTWIPPSPNLKTPEAAAWYPVLCWYEGTIVSVGRGTEKPFEQIGFPQHVGFHRAYQRDSALKEKTHFSINGVNLEITTFTPKRMPNASYEPPCLNQLCYGVRFIDLQPPDTGLFRFGLQLLFNCYHEYREFYKKYDQYYEPPVSFFNSYFQRLAGDTTLQESVLNQKNPEEIYNRWERDIRAFKKTRLNYLLYPD